MNQQYLFKLHLELMQVVDCGKEYIAMKFLLSKTEKDAEKYFSKLDLINQERRILSDKIFEEAVNKIKKDLIYNDNIILIGDESWHSGVTGIVASKLVDLFKKPVIVFSIENGIAQGSGRTINNINIYELINKAENILDEYGGHEKAIGLTLKENKLNNLKQILNEEINKTETDIIEEYDYELKFLDISYDILDSIEELAPFGEKNQKPDFLFKNIEVVSVNVYGNMLKLNLKQNNIFFTAIGFGLGYRQENKNTRLKHGDKIFLIGKLEENIYLGMSSIQIMIKDFNKTKNKV